MAPLERKVQFKDCKFWVGGETFVQAMDMRFDGNLDDFIVKIDLINNHNVALNALEYELVFYDSIGLVLNDKPEEIKAENLNISPKEIATITYERTDGSHSQARSASIKIIKAHFEGGNSLDLIYDEMQQITLEHLGETDLIALQELAGADSRNLPIEKESFWRCICGYFNFSESESCNHCKRLKAQVLTDYKDMNVVREKLNSVLDQHMEKIENIEPKAVLEKAEVKEKRKKIKMPDFLSLFKKRKVFNERGEEISIYDFFNYVSKGSLFIAFISGILIMAALFMIIFNFI